MIRCAIDVVFVAINTLASCSHALQVHTVVTRGVPECYCFVEYMVLDVIPIDKS